MQTETTARLVLAGAVTGLILALLVLIGLELTPTPAPRRHFKREHGANVTDVTRGKGRP